MKSSSQDTFKQATASAFSDPSIKLNKTTQQDAVNLISSFNEQMKGDKKKKIESKEQLIKKAIKKGISDKLVSKKKLSKPIGKMTSISKSEPTEATGSGSSGSFVGPIAFSKDFMKRSNAENPKPIKEDIGEGETTEATTTGSSGAYETPSAWAKSTKAKDWGGKRKTQYPGGSFVSVKKKCTKFPYCNQGDINALKLTKNESVSEAIKNVANKLGLKESYIRAILEYEYEKLNKRNK